MENMQNGHAPPDAQPTPASQWRKSRREGYTITLPSENKATIRPVALDQLIRKGDIPDFLTPVAAKSLWAETDSSEIGQDQNMNSKFLELIDYIVPLAMVSPQVVENPEEGRDEIALSDIEFYDKVAIFNLAIQSVSVLKSFRDEQAKRMASIRSGEDDEQ